MITDIDIFMSNEKISIIMVQKKGVIATPFFVLS